jgi:hypothetical protein
MVRTYPICVWIVLILFRVEDVHAIDGLLDFSVVRPPVIQDRVIKEPIMTWLVQPDAPSVLSHCKKLTGFDGGSMWREGCVAWSVEGARCTMVTSKNTSHSLMGRLLTLCLLAGGEPS